MKTIVDRSFGSGDQSRPWSGTYALDDALLPEERWARVQRGASLSDT